MQAARTEIAKKYEHEGYVIVRDVLDADLIAEASGHVEWLQRRHPDLSSEELGTRLVQGDPFWVRLVSDDRLLDVAEQFVGPNIALFASHYISKPPYDGRPVLWHQDGSYWPLDPMEVVTLWLAVDDATRENGCMQVIPGTQTWELQELQQRSDVDSVLGSGMDDGLVDESRAVDIVLGAGDVEIHHPNIVHGSHANTSARRRCGLTIRYIPTTTRIITDKPWPSAYLLRGEAVSGVNAYQPRPSYVEGVHMPFDGCEAFSGSR